MDVKEMIRSRYPNRRDPVCRKMNVKDAIRETVFRFQLFAFSLVTSMLIFQYEILMNDRGVPIHLSLVVYSLSQIVIIFATLFWGKAITFARNKDRLIQISLIIRLVITVWMCIAEQKTLFILLFLLYHTVSSSIDIAFEGLMGRWSYRNRRPFGKFRLFGSMGYASSGLAAGFILSLTKNVNDLLVFILLLNFLIFLGNLFFPLNGEMEDPPAVRKGSGMGGKRVTALLFLCAVVVTLPNSFGVVLNNHYRTAFQLDVEAAVFWAGAALLLGSFLSEVTGFFFVDRLIERYGAKNIIFAGIGLSLLRWVIALFAGHPELFTATYLFHGVSFAFLYLGCVNYVREKFGESAVSEVVVNFSLYAGIICFLLTQVFSLILTYFTTGFILSLFIFICLLMLIFYYFSFWK